MDDRNKNCFPAFAGKIYTERIAANSESDFRKQFVKVEEMSKVLIVVDMQNDFVTGVLERKDAQAIVPNVKKKSCTFYTLNIF